MTACNHQQLPSGTRIKYWRAGVDRSGGAQLASSHGGQTRTEKRRWLAWTYSGALSAAGDEHKKVVTFFNGVAWIVVMGRFVQALELMRPPSEREGRHMTLQSKWPIGTERFTEAEESTDFSGMHIP